MPPPTSKLRTDARKLAGATLVDQRTAEAWLRGNKVLAANDTALRAAARRLGISAPPPTSAVA